MKKQKGKERTGPFLGKRPAIINLWESIAGGRHMGRVQNGHDLEPLGRGRGQGREGNKVGQPGDQSFKRRTGQVTKLYMHYIGKSLWGEVGEFWVEGRGVPTIPCNR